MLTHGAGWAQQKMQGGYERNTQMIHSMFNMNTQQGLQSWYGGNHQMMGGYYGQGAYANHGYPMTPGYW